MEIDITRFFNESEPSEFSASSAERGNNVAKETWKAAQRKGKSAPLLKTPEQLDAMRDFAKGFGAWSEGEIAKWTKTDCNALLIQFISGDMRESDLHPGMTDAEWKEYEERASEGQVSGRIYGGPMCVKNDGKVWFSLD